jgi:predicted outer membrane protein
MQKLMRGVGFVVLTVSLASSGTAGQTAKTPVAKITLCGKQLGVTTVTGSDGKDRFVEIEIDARTTIKVKTDQDVFKFAEQTLAEHEKLSKAFAEKAKKFAEKNDIAGIKKAEQEFQAASDELLKNIDNVISEGTVSMSGNDLRMDGKLRRYDFKGADKAIGRGKALVEGEVTQVKYDAGQGEKTMLAIHNGPKAIVLTGKAVETQMDAKGNLRVIGVLRPGKDGNIVLDAEKIEAVKK